MGVDVPMCFESGGAVWYMLYGRSSVPLVLIFKKQSYYYYFTYYMHGIKGFMLSKGINV